MLYFINYEILYKIFFKNVYINVEDGIRIENLYLCLLVCK